jgi:23S rRNA pseudouridine1911/1915/1917 synthase
MMMPSKTNQDSPSSTDERVFPEEGFANHGYAALKRQQAEQAAQQNQATALRQSDAEGAEDYEEEPEDEGESLYVHHQLVADPKQGPMRLDKFMMAHMSNATRNKVQTAIDNGFIKVNEQQAKASYKVKPGDVMTIALPEPRRETDILPENIPLNIVYEDDTVLVIDKPAGMVVHPAHSNWEGTLINALVYHFNNLPTGINGVARPGLVHRIDKDTSGLLVIAKTEKAMTHLAKQFFYHTIERKYIAMVWSVPAEAEGTINIHLGRHPKDRRITTVFPEGDQGKHAITHYKVIEDMRYVSLIECQLETGRTHQIRAHMRHLGHPLFNDATYGGDRILKGNAFARFKAFVDNCFSICPRQALHAKSLGFIHPTTEEYMFFESPIPADMQGLMDKWRHYLQYE